jgi:two-component system sensor histidine kinase HydH
MSERKVLFLTIVVMVVAISILHYATNPRLEMDQVIYAKLYYIPVALAALIYGLRGGLLTAVVIAMIYGPSLALQRSGPRPLILDFALDLTLLFATGLVVGLIVDREREHHRKAQEAERLASLGRAAAMMAHEMRSPLVAIGGFTRMLLRRGDPADDSVQKLEIIKVECARLERLVRDALDLGRSRPMHIAGCRVKDLLARARNMIGPQAELNGVQIVETCDPADVEVDCDQERVMQVLTNLLDNAIHYSPKGGAIHLSVRSAASGKVLFEVCDSGKGIPDEMLENLFEPFAGRREGGTGLGLAIAQRIVQAHGSRIEAANLSRGGACFRFDLPRRS